MCLDPGKDNFAYAIVCGKGLMKTGMLRNTVNSFSEKEHIEKVKLFQKEILSIVDRFKIDAIVAERYLVRSGQSKMGASCEYISYMLGFISKICRERNIELHLVTPSVWKQFCIRTFKENPKTPLTETFGFFGLSKNFSNVPLREHQFDAMGISLYWYNRMGYDVFDLRKRISRRLFTMWKDGRPEDKRNLRSYLKVTLKTVK
jgi:Holliday junction resolvasome RuvABC endonuclease subunit